MKIKIKQFSFDSGSIKWWQLLIPVIAGTVLALAAIFKRCILKIIGFTYINLYQDVYYYIQGVCD